jgi:hypothetical protein
VKALVVSTLAAVLLASPAGAAPSKTDSVEAYGGDAIFPRGLPWAPNEDTCYSYRCVWDARHQGNGEGQSLILTKYQGGFLMKPITHRRAHWLQAQYCERPQVACGYGE